MSSANANHGDPDVISKGIWEDDSKNPHHYQVACAAQEEAAAAEAEEEEEGGINTNACYVCLEGSDDENPLLRGCACRGSAGFGHMGCFVDSAKADGTSRRWSTCPTCKQHYTGRVQAGLAKASAEHARAQGLIDVDAITNQGFAKLDAGDSDGAVAIFRRALAYFRLVHGANVMSAPGGGALALNLASALASGGKYDEALPILEEVLDGTANSDDPSCKTTASSAKQSLAGLYCNQGKFEKALPLSEEALAEARIDPNPDPERLVQAMSTLSNLHCSLRNHDQAIALGKEGFETSKRVFGPAHPISLAMEKSFEGVKEWATVPDELNQLEIDVSTRNASHRAEAKVVGVTSRPELNGVKVKVGSYLPSSGRYRIFISLVDLVDSDGANDDRVEEAEINAANLILEPKSRVVIHGLANARDKNGETGVVERFNDERGRYAVALDGRDGTIVRVKPTNVRLLQ